MGCRVEDKATERAQKGETWRVQLVQAPQYDGTFYDQQIMPAKSGKKKGKGAKSSVEILATRFQCYLDPPHMIS